MNARRPTPGRSGARGFSLAVATAFVVLALVTVSKARESNVLLIHASRPSVLLGEALVHVRGEFSSVGLGVQVVSDAPSDVQPEFAPGTYGALSFEESPGWLVIRAYHPSSGEPVVQRLRTDNGHLAPHVVAVRAVEALRAALQQYYYTTNKDIPDPVKKIARIQDTRSAAPLKPQPKTPAKAAATPKPASSPPSAKAPSEGSAVARDRSMVGLWLAPVLLFDGANRELAGGLSGAVSFGRAWYAAALGMEGSVLPFQFEASSGSARVQRLAVDLEFRGSLALGESAAGFVRVGAGLAHYRVQGSAASGYESAEGTHSTPICLLGFGAEYWQSPHFAWFANGQLSLALDAPTLRFAGEPTRPLERPLLGLGLGVVIGSGR